jgi:hypothetical protein
MNSKYFLTWFFVGVLLLVSCDDDEQLQTQQLQDITGRWEGTFDNTQFQIQVTSCSNISFEGLAILGSSPTPETMIVLNGKRMHGDSISFSTTDFLCAFEFKGKLSSEDQLNGICEFSCERSPVQTKEWSAIKYFPQDGMYQYTGFDSSGVKKTEGWFTLEFVDSIQVKGRWQLTSEGHIVGEDSLVGTFQNCTLSLNLNPHYVDNNTILHGTKQGKKINGTWTYSTIAGPVNGGSFVAIKQ